MNGAKAGRLPDYKERFKIATCATYIRVSLPRRHSDDRACRRSSGCATTRRKRPNVYERRRANPVQALRQLSSSWRDGPDVVADLRERRPYARAIANAMTNRTMPPWHADAPAGTFHNERSLTDEERQTLRVVYRRCAQWRSERPAIATNFTEGSNLGKPDLVLEMLEDYRVPAKGTIQYRMVLIPTNFTEAKWVKSIEVRPGNRAAVHHVLVYYRATPDRQGSTDCTAHPDTSVQSAARREGSSPSIRDAWI